MRLDLPKGLAAEGVLFARGLVDVGEAVREDQGIEGLGLGDMGAVPTARLGAKIGLDAAIIGVDPVVGSVAVGEVFDALFVGFLSAGDVERERTAIRTSSSGGRRLSGRRKGWGTFPDRFSGRRKEVGTLPGRFSGRRRAWGTFQGRWAARFWPCMRGLERSR